MYNQKGSGVLIFTDGEQIGAMISVIGLFGSMGYVLLCERKKSYDKIANSLDKLSDKMDAFIPLTYQKIAQLEEGTRSAHHRISDTNNFVCKINDRLVQVEKRGSNEQAG